MGLLPDLCTLERWGCNLLGWLESLPLRVFQRIICSAGVTISPGALFDMEQFADVEPLVPSAIDDLCERLNCEGGL
jgi:hypothetical protein